MQILVYTVPMKTELQSLYTSMKFNFLYAGKYVFPRSWLYPEETVPYCMLRCIICGEADFVINGITYTVQKDDIVYIPEGCTMSCAAHIDDFEFISVRFVSPALLNVRNFLTEYFNVQTVTKHADSEVCRYFYEIFENSVHEKMSSEFRIRGNLELIIAWLIEKSIISQTMQKPKTDIDYFSLEEIRVRETTMSKIKRDPRIQIAVNYLISHPTEYVDSEFLAKAAEMSQSSLRRLFKKQTGKSPMEFVSDLRLTIAARRLLSSEDRISDIAYELCFTDPNYFSRSFKANFGVTPQDYRRLSRAN